MSILFGKAEKFTSAGKSAANTENPFSDRLRPGQLKSSLPPKAYQRIKTGTEMDLQMEDAQALPVDGTKQILRALSPFLIQVEPPLAFANEPKSTGKGKATGIFDAAYKGTNSSLGGNAAARAGFYTNDALKGAPDEVLARNAPSPQTAQSGDGNLTLASDGTGAVGKLGNPSIADLQQALDIVSQLAAIQNSPPLVLLINPNDLSMTYNRIHQFTDRSRFGYIYQAWGEEQPRLSIVAKCGAFISGGRGVQMASRRDSAAWQNLMTLFHLYKSNGYIYDTLGKSNAHLFVGGLSIHYDGWIYYGNMESFSWTYDETNQMGGVEFSIEFVVSTMIDTSKTSSTILPMRKLNPNPQDPRYIENVSVTQQRQGASNLSVGFDGDARGRIFGADPSQQPAENTTQPNAGFGDPDFTKAPPSGGRGNTSVALGGGFAAPAVAVSKAVTGFAQRTQPFKRGD